jgi:hypothetical protein
MYGLSMCRKESAVDIAEMKDRMHILGLESKLVEQSYYEIASDVYVPREVDDGDEEKLDYEGEFFRRTRREE